MLLSLKSHIQEKHNLLMCADGSTHNITIGKIQKEAKKKKKNMSVVTCQVSGVRCHLSHVRCHLSPVTRHLLPATCHLSLMPTATATGPGTVPNRFFMCWGPRSNLLFIHPSDFGWRSWGWLFAVGTMLQGPKDFFVCCFLTQLPQYQQTYGPEGEVWMSRIITKNRSEMDRNLHTTHKFSPRDQETWSRRQIFS